MSCRFELIIKGTKAFQCAAKFGPNGWAYLWEHNGVNDPCGNCQMRIEGKPLVIPHELKFLEFCEVSGKRIRRVDWDEFKRRGVTIKPKRMQEIKNAAPRGV